MKRNITKSAMIAYTGLFAALAMIFSYLELLLPINMGIPGAKLGLANIVIVVVMYVFGDYMAISVNLIRILWMAVLFGSPMSFAMACFGAIVSYIAMVIARLLWRVHAPGVGVCGGVFHNVGQIFAAWIFMGTGLVWYYLPVLMLAGWFTGLCVGILAQIIIHRCSQYKNR